MQLALLCFVCTAVLLAHSALGMGHDGDSDHHSIQDVGAVCLAIVEAGAVFVLLSKWLAPMLRRHIQGGVLLQDLPRWARTEPTVRARAGPARLQVFRL